MSKDLTLKIKNNELFIKLKIHSAETGKSMMVVLEGILKEFFDKKEKENK